MSIGTTGAIIAAGALGAGASIFGANQQSNAAGAAANTQAGAEERIQGLAGAETAPLLTSAAEGPNIGSPIIQAGTDQANQLLSSTLGTDMGLLLPYTNAGSTAESQISAGLQPGGTFNSAPTADQILAQDPGYQFRLQQGQLALERSAAAKGGAASGGALKALTQYGQDYATSEYQQAFQNYNTQQTNLFNRLQSTAQGGLSATQTGVGAGTALATGQAGNIVSGASQQNANQVNTSGMEQSDLLNLLGIQGNAISGAANATASGYIGAANAQAGAASNVSSNATNAILLQKLLGSTSGTNSTNPVQTLLDLQAAGG